VQWSGALAGSATTVSGSLDSSNYLFLDVWDAASHHIAISIFVTVCQDGQISC
jgi:hypothetical protein